MEKKKGNSVVIILLLLIIILMGICIYLMYNGTIKTKGSIVDNCVHESEVVEDVGNNSQIYSYNDLKGYYTEVSPSEEGWKSEESGFNLYLYDNGVFRYNMSYMAPFGYQGYYYIDNNTIKLVYIFSYNSGAGLTLTEGSRTMTIDDEGIIMDNEKKEVGDESKVVSLSKTDLPQDFDKYKNISSQLNNTIIINKVGSTVPSSAGN